MSDVQIVTPAASVEEAAAIVAAVQRFLGDHAPVFVEEARRKQSPWQRAALLEGTGREPDAPSPWGDPVPWGN